MRVRIGNWMNYGGLSIELLTADAIALKADAVDRFAIEVNDRMVVVSPCRDGAFVLTNIGVRHQPGYTYAIACHKRPTDHAAGCARFSASLPAFELMDFELDIQGEGEDFYMAGELPADHELPWPSKRSLKALDLDIAASFCEDAVQARLNSAIASGLTSLPIPVPQHIRAYSAPGVYMRCLQTARSLSGVMA